MTEKNYPSPFHRVTNERISFLLPDLIEIQRNSFYEFLETGIIEEFSKINPVLLNSGEICVVFYPKEYQFTSPPFSIREAILHGKTYSAKLYVPAQICCKRTEILSQISSSKLKKKKFVPKHKGTEFLFNEKTKKVVKKRGEKEKIISNISNEKINHKEVKSLSTCQTINPFGKNFEKWDWPNLLQEPQFQIWSLKCWVLLGNLPLMTKRGHFIINGSPRVIVSQMIRCPGVYFHERFRGIGIQKKRTCYVDFISRRGAWLRIQSDKNRDIWIRLKRTPRIPLDIFQEGFKSFERYGKFESKSNLLDKSKKYKNSLNTLSKIIGSKGSSQMTFSFFEKKENQQGGKVIQNTSDLNSKKISLAFGTGHDLNLLSNFQLEDKRPLSFYPKTKLFSQSSSQTNTETWTDFQPTETSVHSYPEGNPEGNSFPLKKKREEGYLRKEKIEDSRSSFPGGKQKKTLVSGIDVGDLDTSVSPLLTPLSGSANRISPGIPAGNLDTLVSRNLSPKGDRIENSKTVIFGIKKTKVFSKENWKRTTGQKNLLSPIEVQKKEKTKKNFYHRSYPEGVRTFDTSYKNSYERSIFSELFDEVQENGTKLDQSGSYNFENGKGEDLAAVGGLQFIFQKFKNPRTYDLGKLGRDRINSKLNTYTLSRQLNSKDIEFACSYLKRIEKNQILPDDIDNLKNRRVRAAGELLQAQLETGLYRLERFILSRLKPTLDTVRSPEWNSLLTKEEHTSLVRKSPLSKKWKGNAVSPYANPIAGQGKSVRSYSDPDAGPALRKEGKSFPRLSSLAQGKGGNNLFTRKKKPIGLLSVLLRSLITTKAINGAFREFFGSNPLSQYMDQTNPLAEVTHKRRLSSLGPGGISRDTAGMAIRGIHSTHYGRICPIETPEGKNAGLVNSLTLFAQGTETGFLKTPYYKVYKGQVQKNSFPFFFSANSEQQMGITIAPGDLHLSSSHFLPPFSLPARIAGTFEDPFRRVKREKINYIALSPLQMISIATSLIPFLEHDDANRALMGSNMQRQAVPLLKPERPIVGTGLESLVVAESGQTLESQKRGLVLYSSSEKILLHKLPTEGSSWTCSSLVFPFRSFLVHGKSSEQGRKREKGLPWPATGFGLEQGKQSDFLQKNGTREGLLFGGKQLDFLQENGTRKCHETLAVSSHPRARISGISPLLTPLGGTAKEILQKLVRANGFSVRKLDTLVFRKKGKKMQFEKRKYLVNGTRKCIKTLPEEYKYTAKVSDFSNLSPSGDKLLDAKVSKFPFADPPRWGVKTQGVAFEPLKGVRSGDTKVSKYHFADPPRWDVKTQGVAFEPLKGVRSGDTKVSKFPAGIPGEIPDTKVFELPTSILSVQFLNRFEVLRLPTVGCESLVPSLNGQRGLQRIRILGISPKLSFITTYPLYTYQRSNQETSMSHRPAVREGDWVQKGDLLADCSASSRGELALGKNILIAYLPWEGYNFEDAVVASETLASEDLYTSVHVEKHEIEIRESRLALEEITPNIPHITKKQKESLDSKGLIKIGRWVDQGDILVAKTTAIKPKPLSPHQKLAFDLARLKPSKIKDTSLRVPKGVHGRVIRVEVLETTSVPLHLENRKILNSSFKLSSLGESFEKNGDRTLQYEKKIYKNIHKIFCESSKENTWKRKQKKILFFLCNNEIFVANSRSSPYISTKKEQGKQLESTKEIETRESFDTLAVYSHSVPCASTDATPIREGSRGRFSEHRWNKEKFLSLYSFQNLFFNGSLGIEQKDLKEKEISSGEQKEICLPILLEGKEKTFFQNQLKKAFLPRDKSKANMSVFVSKSNGFPLFPYTRGSMAARASTMQSFPGGSEYSGLALPKQGWPEYSHPLVQRKNPFSPSFEEARTAYEKDLNSGKKVFFCLMSNLSDSWNFRKWVCKNIISKNARKLTRSKNIFNFFVVSQKLPTRAILRSPVHLFSSEEALPSGLEQGNQRKTLSSVPLFPSREGSENSGLASRKKGWPEYSHPLVQGKNPFGEVQGVVNTQRCEDTAKVSKFSIHDQKPKSSVFANKFYGPSWFGPRRFSTSRSRREDVFKRKNEGNFLKKEAAFQYRVKNTIISNVEMEQDLISKRRIVPTRVRIYLAEKRKIQVGDKVAGRHGNKGIISVVLPRIDMPYLPDGRVVDMILNPLGVPSRMNVGQVFECLLGLAGVSLNQHYRIPPFDEMYGPEASRSLVYLKLYQARLRSGQHWLFHPTSPGKTRLTDGRTGEPFDQLVTTGTAYIIKLVHLVDEKIHARSTGPYSLVTKQPLGGRSKHGGQRLGEMEVWALEGFGAAYTLQEMLTSKSDDVLGRQEVLKGILSKKASPLGNPEAFKVLVRELQSLCLDIRVSVLRGSPMRRERVDISEIK